MDGSFTYYKSTSSFYNEALTGVQVVIEEARSKQATAVSELEWLGFKLPVNNEKTRMCILKGSILYFCFYTCVNDTVPSQPISNHEEG